jgi:predicted ester cyclase
MDSKATVQALIDAVQMGDFQKAQSFLSDDFQFSGPVPVPLSGPAWLGMSANLKTAFPDLDYQFKVESVDGDTLNISAQLKGTHKGNLDLTAMGMSVIPPTNKSFAAAYERGKVIVENGKVKTWATQATEGAGLMAILGQLGVKLPTM